MPDSLPRALPPRRANDRDLRARGRGTRPGRYVGRAVLCLLAFLLSAATAPAQVDLPEPNLTDPILVTAETANHWMEGSYEVWLLRGDCRIRQGMASAHSQEAVLWILRADAPGEKPSKVIAYLEGKVVLDLPKGLAKTQVYDDHWLGRFTTIAAVEVHAGTVSGRPDVLPPVYQHGLACRDPSSKRGPRGTPTWLGGTPENAAAPGRRIRAFSRSGVSSIQFQWSFDPNTNQWVGVFDSGVVLIVDGLADLGSIDVSTDRMVIWTTGAQEPDLRGGALQSPDVPLEIYMEGNIVFKQGSRDIYADRMYYDVRNQVGTVINADVLTPAPKYQGKLRLHTELLEQYAPDRFFAENAFFTSSRVGTPGYRVQVGDVTFQDIQMPVVDVFGRPVRDPETEEPAIANERLATGHNAVMYVEDVPFFYWPTFATDLNDPTYYIRRLGVKNDNVFGTQILTSFDTYQLLGIRHKPAGTDWTVGLDYLSLRGFGYGTTYQYHRDNLFGLPGQAGGIIDYWGIQDHGLDLLGGERNEIEPEKTYRYRLFGQHRQQLPDDFQLSVELGVISDRDFVEEYYKREWDENKDESTGFELKRTHENYSYSLSADVRMNDFFVQTEWLPRLDHFWLGQPLLGNTLTWYEHSEAGFARFEAADPPTNPQYFNYLPWEVSRQGERVSTRQELDLPLQLGPVKVVPYGLGELADWGEDLYGNRVQRAYGVAGLRASIPIWSVNPDIQSTLWNVHGVAHKVVFDVDASVAGANQPLTDFPLYDSLDDDAVTNFRRRFIYTTFGITDFTLAPTGQLPGTPYSPLSPLYTPINQRFDERFYALRSGLGDWVSSPSTEIAGDLETIRLGIHQRWQTKRGREDQQHIIDWITLDTNVTIFPDPVRDDFGSTVGLFDYDFLWHVGDRLTLFSRGIFDFFDQGQQIVNVGVLLSRPPRGNFYVGVTSLAGPVAQTVLTASYSYWMSPKWISTLGSSIDITGSKSLGESVTITRVGESLLISAAFNADPLRQSVGASFVVEPRFFPKGRFNAPGGGRIPPAGTQGLE
jgi:hypothetical protein